MSEIAAAVSSLEANVTRLDRTIEVAQAHREGLLQALALLRGLPTVDREVPRRRSGQRSIASRTPLLELRAKLVAALTEHGPHGAGALAVICDDHKARVKGELNRMAVERLVHSQGLKRAQRWHLGSRR